MATGQPSAQFVKIFTPFAVVVVVALTVQQGHCQESGQLVLRVLGLPIAPSGWVRVKDSVHRPRRDAGGTGGQLSRARPKLCSGRRLDSAGPYGLHSAIEAAQCTTLGGDCCNLSPAWGYASNDPKRMKPDDACHGCYDSRIRVECTGTALRTANKRHDDGPASRADSDDDGSVTAATCIRSGGKCCDPFLQDVDIHGNATAFDPGQSTDLNASCVNCFDGLPQETGIWNAFGNRFECTGRLLESEDFSADICLLIDGRCCDGIYGPFDPLDYPRRDCQTCYSGTIQIYRP